jgi:AraC-like DNA-binding protein
MTGVGVPSEPIRFSTGTFVERDRTEAWREAIGRAVMGLEIDPLRDAPGFDADLTVRVLPGLVFSQGTHRGMQYDRRASMIDGDDLVLSVVTKGQHVVRQFGREFSVTAGEAVLTTSGDPGLSYNPDPESLLLFRIPRDRIEPLVGDLDSALVRPIDRDVPALKMLLGYAAVLANLPNDAPGDLRQLASAHSCDLIALMLGATRDAGRLALERGVRAARLHAIKLEIRKRLLAQGDLTTEALAASQGISASYVRKLFDGDGTTVGDFVLQQRIARAHSLLTDIRLRSAKISSIAYDVGFSDLSYFNRVFRRHYGCTPSEARDRAFRELG